MKKLLLLLWWFAHPFLSVAACPTGTVQIIGPVRNPDLTPYNGTMTATLSVSTPVARSNSVAITINNGSMVGSSLNGGSACLVPGLFNVRSVSSQTSQQTTTFWQVPSGGGPYLYSSIETTTSSPPTTLFPATSIIPGSVPTSCSGRPSGSLWNNSGVVSICP